MPASAAQPEVRADARLDLVGLVQRLSGDPHAPRNLESDAAAERFAKWAGHPAVTGLAKLRAAGFAWDIPMQYALYLSTPPSLTPALPAPPFFAETAGGAASLEAWRAALADFARVSGFMDWEKEREPRRREELAAVRASLGGADLSADLVAELGAKTWDKWTVTVSPFFARGGVGAWVLEEKAGRPDIVVMYGPDWKPRPAADPPSVFAAWVYPEAAFSMAYAIYDACRPVLKPAADVCAGQHIDNPEDCVQQSWVRGVVARVVRKRYGAEAEEAYRSLAPRTAVQSRIDQALDGYDRERTKYKDLMDFRGPLIAPFVEKGKDACPVVDPARWSEKVYARRLAYYLDGRLEAHPDPELEKVRARLAAFRAAEPK